MNYLQVMVNRKHTRKFLWQCFLVFVIFHLVLIICGIQIYEYMGERNLHELLKTALAKGYTCTHIQNGYEHNTQSWSTNLSFLTFTSRNLKILKSTNNFFEALEHRILSKMIKIRTLNQITNPMTSRKPIIFKYATSESTHIKESTKRAASTTIDPRIVRCAKVRHRVSQGVLDYINDHGDAELQELIKPLFHKKKLVVWSLDHHIGPISDLRSLFEPLGVEFIEHTLYHNCDLMCTCEQQKGFPIFNSHNIIYVNPDDFERFYKENKNEYDIERSHVFLVSYSMAILPLYSLFNRSVIAVASLRYERTVHSDKHRWYALNEHIRTLATHKRHVIGANSLYDKEYMRYFTGIVPDLIPSFCAYTGAHYNPTRMSYLYARRPWIPLGNTWHTRVVEHFSKIKGNFKIHDLTHIYKQHEYSDVAAHLGVVYVPYQTSIMMFFEQYTMGIPLFAPTLDFLVHLHMVYYVVYDKTMINSVRQSGSIISPHASMNGSFDPNNDADIDSVRHWLSLSDYYHFPNVTLFNSIEDLVEILEPMTKARLKVISENMMKYNRERLKSILRYWRRRLGEIAAAARIT